MCGLPVVQSGPWSGRGGKTAFPGLRLAQLHDDSRACAADHAQPEGLAFGACQAKRCATCTSEVVYRELPSVQASPSGHSGHGRVEWLANLRASSLSCDDIL